MEEEENIISLGLSKSSHYSSAECSSFYSFTQKSDTVIVSMGDDKTQASLTSKSDLSSFPLVEEIPPRNDGLILRHINGFAKHGEMTAILGARYTSNETLDSSGAGKTTLLSVLCGRNSNFTGNFTINGNKVNATSLRRVCRFVRQHDLFYEFLTVEEHLYYQAILRLGDRPEKEIRNRLIWARNDLGTLTHSLQSILT